MLKQLPTIAMRTKRKQHLQGMGIFLFLWAFTFSLSFSSFALGLDKTVTVGENHSPLGEQKGISVKPNSLDQPFKRYSILEVSGVASLKAQKALIKAEAMVLAYLDQASAVDGLAKVFSGADLANPSASVARVSALLSGNSLLSPVKVVLRPSKDLMGAWAVFAAKGHQGLPMIYLNEVAAETLSEEQLVRVLVEEMGHWMDFQINDSVDSPGDEGELFAAEVFDYQLTPEQYTRILGESDFLTLTIEGIDVETELASLLFSNRPSFWIGSTATSAVQSADVLLETNIVYVRGEVGVTGDRYLFISIPESDVWFSGNNTKGWLYVVGADNKIKAGYIGEISRLFKNGSSVDGLQFYVYPEQREDYVADRQTPSTSILIDLRAGFQVNQSYNTSSDPVAAALNALLVPAPVVGTNDVDDLVEAGGARVNQDTSEDPTGNVLSNDTGGLTNYSVDKSGGAISTWTMVTSSTSLTVVNAGTLTGNYGSLVLGADGAYTYTLDNLYPTVEALRVPENTLSEAFKYQVAAGSEQASATLTITITGANDAPVAADDYDVAKESLELLVANQYAILDPLGSKAIGDVFLNDEDVDQNGETKSITGTTIRGSATGSSEPGSSSLTLQGGGSLNSLNQETYIAYRKKTDGSYEPIKERDNTTNAILSLSGGGNTITFSISDASNVLINDLLAVNTGGSTFVDIGTVTVITTSPTSVVNLTNIVGTVAVGMEVTGTGLTPSPTISTVNYTVNTDGDAVVSSIVLSQAVSISGAALTFTKANAAGATIIGQYGTLVLQSDGSYVYTPTPNNPNISEGQEVVEAFDYAMEDFGGLHSAATLYITVLGSGINDPNAVPETANAAEAGGARVNQTPGYDATGDLLLNSTSPSGAGSNFVSGIKTSQVGTFTGITTPSPVYDGVSYDMTVSGLYGILYVKTTGEYIYVVNNALDAIEALKLGESLTDNFQYEISNDFASDRSTLTITIDGAYDTPVAVADVNSAVVGLRDGTLVSMSNPTGNVLPNDTDVDANDAKTVTKAGTDTANTAVSGATEITGTYGTLTINADGTYSYAVNLNNSSVIALNSTGSLTDTFRYEVTDGGSLSSVTTLTITITALNQAPVNDHPASVELDAGTEFVFTGDDAISVTDVDGNLSSVTVTVENGLLFYDGLAEGETSITLTGTEAEINAILATLKYVPNDGFVGTDFLSITSVDVEFLVDLTVVELNVVATELTVNSVTVNEASNWIVFEVGGLPSQKLTLSVRQTANVAETDAFAELGASPALEIWNGTEWVAYSTEATIPASGPLYVRVNITEEQDPEFEGAETFKLIATNTANTDFEGTGTIKDDGTGDYWIGDSLEPATEEELEEAEIVLDDDRALTVNSVTVNEASPYAVFTVSGAPSQLVSLPLADGTATVADYGSGLEYFDGTDWVTYSAGDLIPLDENGELYVRTPIKQDDEFEGSETFKLIATNTGDSDFEGTGTIKDDGTGDYFIEDSLEPATEEELEEAEIVLDDDRALTVNSVTVNEASPFVIFEVSGGANQLVSLALADGTATVADYGSGLEYFDGTDWVTYSAGDLIPLDENGELYVRTPIKQDDEFEGSETFKLIATNTGDSDFEGTGTIKDDGTGDYWIGDSLEPATEAELEDDGIVLDDDRVLSVNNVTVNEASPYSVFTVSGAAGQLATLSLADGTATEADYGPGLEYFNGTTWVAYTAGTQVALDGSGKLQVRTPIKQDDVFEGAETFTLTATNTGGTPAVGTGTVKDDGTGTIFNEDGTEDTTTVKDDDRALAVSSPTVNEGSPYVVFTVSGAPNQLVSLTLANVTTTGLTGLGYSTDGGKTWTTYTSGNVALDGSGKMLVRTSLTPEQETEIDNGETLTLTATNTSGTPAVGTGTVKDDGTGTIFKEDGTEDTTTVKDDDRALAVSSPTVNEGSPYVVFTVSGAPNQLVSLALANVTTTGLTGLEYSTDGGQTWTPYTSGNVALDGNGKMLVRTSLTPEQETEIDNGETLTLTATNTSGSSSLGTGTVKDDGTGTIFKEDGTEDTTMVKDDDRALAVSSPTVNEGSPYVVFTVSGAPNQLVSLALANVTTTGLTGLEYSNDGGQTWTTYTSGNVALDGNGKMLVRTSLTPEQETEIDNGETLTLTATNTSGTPAVGTGTVKDDGTGTIFNEDGTEDTTTVKDDDRALAVSSPTVNEGSPYVVFTVSGAPNQLVSLALANVTTTGLTGLEYSADGGKTWTTYTSGNVALDGNGKMLVRTSLTPEQEAASDNGETLTLTATNTSGSSSLGTGTVKDDGTGTIFSEDGTEDTAAQKDDDRALTVNSVVVNEIDPFAEFTVTGAKGQLVSLALADGTATAADYGPSLEYFNGTAWVSYSPGSLVELGEDGKLKVRIPINQDEILEGKETFSLIATNTGGTPAAGVATIIDYVTLAEDDFAAVRGTADGSLSVSGNVLDNDFNSGGEDVELTATLVTDPEGLLGTLVFDKDGSYTFTPAPGFSGLVEVVYTVCGGDPFESCDTATLFITVDELILPQPDFNATYLGSPVKGTLATNDDIPADATFGTPEADESNPEGAELELNPDGTYVFEATLPGVYTFQIPVCTTDGTCVITTLTITVKERGEPQAPILNTDLGVSKQGSPVVVNTLGNDAPGRPNVTLDPATVQVTVQPKNGTVTVDPETGDITYTPNPGFVGKDSYTYTVCDNGDPVLCATAVQEVTILAEGSGNVVVAADDFAKGPNGSTLKGNVLINDRDLDGQPLSVTPQSIQLEEGAFTLNADGTFEFIPTPGYIGPVQITYVVCDGGDPVACASATIYLLVAPNDIEAIMDNFQDNEINGLLGGIAGNVLTNDLINGNPVKPADVIISVKDDGGMTGLTIDQNGNLLVPNGTAPGTYVITYSICDANDPINCSEAMVVVEVFHGVNLSISKDVLTPTMFEGDEIVYLIRVVNDGNTPAANVEVVDVLPGGLTYVSSSVSGSAGSATVSGQEIKWRFASIPAGGFAEITLRVKADALADGREKSITNTATVNSQARELSPENNSSSAVVTIRPFFIPNVISPNGDGKNDVFVINGLGKFASNELVIFNRFGDHVFERKGYQNDWNANGLVSGTYFYVLSVVDANGNNTAFKGWIQVIRED